MKSTHVVIGVACLVALMVCGGVLFAVIAPAMLAAREAARRMNCSNNLKLVGLGIHNYHSAYKQLPMASGGTGGTTEANGNAYRLSGLAALLPFLEQQPLWEEIANPYPADSPRFPQMGPVPWYDSSEYPLFASSIVTYRCPSDPAPLSGTNYAFCYGDAIRYVGMSQEQIAATLSEEERSDPEAGRVQFEGSARGAFASRGRRGFRDCLDGLSNTIGMAEIVSSGEPSLIKTFVARDLDPGLINRPDACRQLADATNPRFYSASAALWNEPRGLSWADGNIRFTGVTTVLPPNSPSCSTTNSELEGVYSASSHHQGGCHVLMMDGAVIFIMDSIEAGDASKPSIHFENEPGKISPYGLWGALGTRANNELIDSMLSE